MRAPIPRPELGGERPAKPALRSTPPPRPSRGGELARVVDRNINRAAAIADGFDAASGDDPRSLWDDAAPDSMVALLGDRGGLTFELFGDHLLLRNEIAGRNADAKVALPVADQMSLQMADFAEAVSSRTHGVGATPAEGRKVQAIIDAIYKSSDTNLPVTL